MRPKATTSPATAVETFSCFWPSSLENAAGPLAVKGRSLGDLAADHPRHRELAGMGRVKGF